MFSYVNMSLISNLSFPIYWGQNPRAFYMTTGPTHWELLLRSRLVVNVVFSFISLTLYFVHM